MKKKRRAESFVRTKIRKETKLNSRIWRSRFRCTSSVIVTQKHETVARSYSFFWAPAYFPTPQRARSHCYLHFLASFFFPQSLKLKWKSSAGVINYILFGDKLIMLARSASLIDWYVLIVKYTCTASSRARGARLALRLLHFCLFHIQSFFLCSFGREILSVMNMCKNVPWWMLTTADPNEKR